MKKFKRSTAFLISVAIFFALTYFFVDGFAAFLSTVTKLFLSGDQAGIMALIRSFGAFSAAISFLLMMLQSLVAPLPAFLITFANASVFGFFYGAVLSWASSMAGALLCFLIAKKIGRSGAKKLIPASRLEKIDAFFEKFGAYSIFYSRLLPFVSFDFVSYAAGFTSIKPASFLVATGLGQLPATLVYSYVGGMPTGRPKLILTGALLAMFVISALVIPLKNRAKIIVDAHLFLSNMPIFRKIYFKNKSCNEKSVVFFPGCSFCGYSPHLVLRVYEFLLSQNPNIGIYTACCGKPKEAFSGYVKDVEQDKIAEKFKENGVSEVVTCCPNCTVFLGEIEWLKVTSIYTLLNKSDIDKSSFALNSSALHDPCPFRKRENIQRDVRNFLERLQVPFTEFENCLGRTRCCGKSNMMFVKEKKRALELARARAFETRENMILTYCFSCIHSFRIVGKESIHVLEVAFGENNEIGNSWFNRMKLVQILSQKR